MFFTLEAVFAKHGDALILHYGTEADPKFLLIDGGASGVYSTFLKPRFQQLRDIWSIAERESYPLEMVMVSHVDADHITGILDLFEDQVEAHDAQQPLPFSIRTLWHNSFDDIMGNQGEEILSRLSEDLLVPGAIEASPMDDDSAAVVASVKQGRDLRKAAEKLGMTVNAPFEGLIMSPAPVKVELAHGLSFTILGPGRARVEDFQERWDQDLVRILAREQEAAEVASFSDTSPFNLASLVVLAEMNGKTMLLTGDARGDYVIEGLVEAGLMDGPDGTFEADLIKLPHHGSDRNVTQEWFEQVTSDIYVVSGDGFHGNPEPTTLQWLADAKAGADYTLYVTFAENAHLTETSDSRREHMEEIQRWLHEDRPANCRVVYRDAEGGDLSVHVDLADPI